MKRSKGKKKKPMDRIRETGTIQLEVDLTLVKRYERFFKLYRRLLIDETPEDEIQQIKIILNTLILSDGLDSAGDIVADIFESNTKRQAAHKIKAFAMDIYR